MFSEPTDNISISEKGAEEEIPGKIPDLTKGVKLNDEENICCFSNEVDEKLKFEQIITPELNVINESKITNEVFTDILQDPNNRICIDCGNANPDWVSIGFGIICCLKCAGTHRSFGTHVTLVRSITMDDWSEDQLKYVMLGGNSPFKAYIESKFKTKFAYNFEKYYLPEISYYR
jgi:hypothetical protein